MPSSTSTLNTHPRSWITNVIRQLKLIVPGAMITYYLGTLDKLVRVLQSEDDAFHRCGGIMNSFMSYRLVHIVFFVLVYHEISCLVKWRLWL